METLVDAIRMGREVGRLPWEWFDFSGERFLARGMGEVLPVEEGGWRRDYFVAVDGRVVPFKVLRRAGGEVVGGNGDGHFFGRRRRVLMLVHGMGLSIASFRGVAGHLLATHDLILPDYSSFSLRTRAEAGGGSPREYVQSLWRMADALGVEKMDLGGNSLGGGMCLMMAVMDGARVGRMVLANPACFPQRLPKMYRLARWPLVGDYVMGTTEAARFVGGIEYIGYVDKAMFEPELRRRYMEAFGRKEMRLRLMGIMRHLPFDARDLTVAPHVERLGEIGSKVLLTWGGRDPLLVEGAGERLAGSLRDVVYERHGDLAHMPHEEDPERVGRRWAGFLNA